MSYQDNFPPDAGLAAKWQKGDRSGQVTDIVFDESGYAPSIRISARRGRDEGGQNRGNISSRIPCQ